MFEFYNELEEGTEDFVGVEHVRVTKRYLRDWENPMEFCNEDYYLLYIIDPWIKLIWIMKHTHAHVQSRSHVLIRFYFDISLVWLLWH